MSIVNGVGSTRYRVLYGDTDNMGVVYYGNYFRLFERGRAELIRERGLAYREIEERGVMLPVTKSFCHYHGSAKYDDLVLIETWVSDIKPASIQFEYRIFRDDTRQEKLVEGYTLHACLSVGKQKLVRLPEFIKEMLG